MSEIPLWGWGVPRQWHPAGSNAPAARTPAPAGLRFQGLACVVWGLGFRVQGSGVWDIRWWVWGVGLRSRNLWYRGVGFSYLPLSPRTWATSAMRSAKTSLSPSLHLPLSPSLALSLSLSPSLSLSFFFLTLSHAHSLSHAHTHTHTHTLWHCTWATSAMRSAWSSMPHAYRTSPATYGIRTNRLGCRA